MENFGVIEGMIFGVEAFFCQGHRFAVCGDGGALAINDFALVFDRDFDGIFVADDGHGGVRRVDFVIFSVPGDGAGLSDGFAVAIYPGGDAFDFVAGRCFEGDLHLFDFGVGGKLGFCGVEFPGADEWIFLGGE